MAADDGERFLRVVGRRSPPGLGVPSPERRRALDSLQPASTCAPKGVRRYASHEAANADRDAWTAQAIADATRRIARTSG